MKINYIVALIFFIVFLFSCAYTSKTTFKVNGKDIKSVYVVASDAEVTVNREMNLSVFK